LHLLSVEIEQFRSIEDQWVPAEGLVVLFGANSAGKTSVLEAAEYLITQAGVLRSDPGDNDDSFVLGSVMFDLPAAGIAGSEDARMYLALLTGEHSKPGLFGEPADPWAELGEGLTRRLTGTDLDQARALLAEALACAGGTDASEDRQILACSVFDPDVVYFSADQSSIGLSVDGTSLPEEAQDAARRIAAIAGDDVLSQLAGSLVSEGWAHVAWVGGGASHWKDFSAGFPPVIVLDGDLESLSNELESAIVAIHNRLWHFELEVMSSFPGGESLRVGEHFHIGESSPSDRYAIDSWLETRSENGDVVSPRMFDPYDHPDWYRVRHSVLAAARLVEEEANRVAPDFVKTQGTIGIEVLPVAVWGSGKHRVRATITEFEGNKRDLRVVGAGTARWAAAAVRLACRRLEKGSQVVRDGTGASVDDENEHRRIVTEAYKAPFTQTAVQLIPSDSRAVYIADEPESHLHPASVQSVREWLSRLAETAATVMVATHRGLCKSLFEEVQADCRSE
jgi:hypothetical protein